MICAGFLFLAPFVLACFILVLQQRFRFSARTVTDLIAVVRCLDERELEDLFDQTKEDNLRVGRPVLRFHEAQRARARLLFEYLRRIGFNSMALLVWAYEEQKRVQSPGMPRNEELAQNIYEIIDLGTEVRFYFVVALSELSVRLLLDELRIVRIRNLPRLRHAAGIDGLESYRRLAQTAVALSAAQGRSSGPRLAALLCGSRTDT
jgi:hypothetical protein